MAKKTKIQVKSNFMCSMRRLYWKTTAQEIDSQIALKNCSEDAGEESGYIHMSFAGKKYIVKNEKDTANQKTQQSQVNSFNSFLYMGRCKNLGSLKIFPRCKSLLSRDHTSKAQSISWFCPSGILLRAHSQWAAAVAWNLTLEELE